MEYLNQKHKDMHIQAIKNYTSKHSIEPSEDWSGELFYMCKDWLEWMLFIYHEDEVLALDVEEATAAAERWYNEEEI
jgi:hypothetical protein